MSYLKTYKVFLIPFCQQKNSNNRKTKDMVEDEYGWIIRSVMRHKNGNLRLQTRNKMMYKRERERERESSEGRIRATVCQRMCLKNFGFTGYSYIL